MKFFISHKKRGFTLIEVLVACTIISISTFAIMSAAQKGIATSNNSLKSMQASLLLEEGAEAVKSLRDSSWSNMSSLTNGSVYYLSYNNTTNVWSLSTTVAPDIDSTFTRTVVVSSVSRDSSDDIVSSGGTVDTHARKVLVTVSWSDGAGSTVSKTLTFYVIDIFS
jgi:prepilin-type N-terminal cleavage/methylation domain-containing protein